MRLPSIMLRSVAALAVAAAAALPADYYVSTDGGDDGNDGSFERPYRTIGKAAGIVTAGGTVFVRGGTYRETVTPANSGVAGSPVTFRPYNGERVIVSGADTVTGWTADGNSIYKAALPGAFTSVMNQSYQVFVDGVMLIEARWPNTTADVSRPVKSTITAFVSKTRDDAANWTTAVFEDDNLSPASDGYYNGAQVYVQPSREAWSWTLCGEVTNHSGKRLTIRSRSNSGDVGDGNVDAAGSRYFRYNKKSLLDAAGEWFIDRSTNTLYLRTWKDTPPSQHTVEVKMRDFGFDLDSRSYVTIRGIGLFACAITTDRGAYEYGGDWWTPGCRLSVDDLERDPTAMRAAPLTPALTRETAVVEFFDLAGRRVSFRTVAVDTNRPAGYAPLMHARSAGCYLSRLVTDSREHVGRTAEPMKRR